MKLLKRFVLETIFIILYGLLVYFLVFLSEITFPKIIFGSWKSYILIGLISELIVLIFQLFAVSLLYIFRFFENKSKVTNVLCVIISILGLVVSLDTLWSFTNALFYVGLGEYLWCAYLSLMLFLIHGTLIFCLFIKKS